MPGALEHHRKALNIYERLLAKDPSNHLDQRALSVSYENIGRALFLSNNPRGALENNQKALALRAALVATDPTNADYRRILGVSYQNNGDYKAWIKDTSGALDSFRKKMAIDEASYNADPANAQARGDLAYGCARMGDLLAESGDRNQAIPYYNRALEFYEKRVAADPQDVAGLHRMLVIQAHLADAQAKVGNIDAAREGCRKTVDLLERSADYKLPVDVQRSAVLAWIGLGDAFSTISVNDNVKTKMDSWSAARDSYQHALNIFQDLRNAGAIDADEIAEIDKLATKVADCQRALSSAH